MELTATTNLRDLRKELELPSKDCIYVVTAARVSDSSRKLDELSARTETDPGVAEMLYRPEEYKKLHIAFERKSGFPPRRVKFRMYMPDGKLRIETVERKGKTTLDTALVSDTITEMLRDFDTMMRKTGNRMPAWCA